MFVTRNFNWKLFIEILGRLVLLEAILMFLSACVDLIYKEGAFFPMLYSSLITFTAAGIFSWIGKGSISNVGTREGYTVVGVVWIVLSVFGMLPYWLSNSIPNFTDALFETISGFTTTGATILENIETIPHAVLFWRSLTQWLGGMGIIVLSLIVLPFIGGGMQLYMAEVPGLTHSKIAPRLRDTASRMWMLYFLLTFSEVIVLWLCGMNLFDAVCHSFATLSSGGFSTKQASIAYWNSPIIHYVIIFYMILSGINFTLLYYMLIKRKFKQAWIDDEFRVFCFLIVFVTVLFTVYISIDTNVDTQIHSFSNVESNFRNSLFAVVTILTSNGFVSYDYTLWPNTVWLIIVTLLMFTGGSSGSTSGGAKVVRMTILTKNALHELKRRVHPNAVIPVKLNRRVVQPEIVQSTYSFVCFFIIIILISALLMSSNGVEPMESFVVSLSALSNMGPAIGVYGPSGTYATLPLFSKWIMMADMLIGRLEIFTILLLFTPTLWRK